MRKCSMRRRPFKGRQGIRDRRHPHASKSQLSLAEDCRRLWRHVYLEGHDDPGEPAEIGVAVHAAGAQIDEIARDSRDGIGPDQVDEILGGRTLASIRRFHDYAQIREGLEKYAVDANAERRVIKGIEFPFTIEAHVPSGRGRTRRVDIVGVIDRFDRLPDGTIRVWERKTWKMIQSAKEIRLSLEANLLAMLVRDHFNHSGKVVVRYHCVTLGKYIDATIEEQSVESTRRFVLGRIESILADRDFRPTFGPRCGNCPLRGRCAEFKEKSTFGGGLLLEATPAMLAKVTANVKLWSDAEKKVRSMLSRRVAVEGDIVQDGFRAWLDQREGHHVDAFDVGPSSVLMVRRELKL